MELVCPAGSLPALKAAIDNGADAVYIGFRDGTNARNFPGLNFDLAEARQGIDYAHRAGRRVFLAINTYPSALQWDKWCAAVDQAAGLSVDALILADPGLMRYCTGKHPQQRLHLSVQGSATNAEAIGFYARQFGVRRVVLPRVLSLTQVRAIVQRVGVEVEVFGFGSLCVMVEGRCALSSYVTGASPNMSGVCSPAKSVRWEETPNGRQSRLNGVLIDTYRPGEAAGYPTLCKGRFVVQGCTNPLRGGEHRTAASGAGPGAGMHECRSPPASCLSRHSYIPVHRERHDCMEAGGRATQGRFGLLPSRDIGTSLYGRAVAENVESDRAGAAEVANKPFYAIEEPTSLNAIEILPALCKAGVAAIKVEGRQRSPAYVAQVTRALREALDACLNDPDHYIPRPDWLARLDKVAEGRCHTLGAYHRPWQ